MVRLVLVSTLMALVFPGSANAQPAQPADARAGKMITIAGVIDSALVNRVMLASREAIRGGAQIIIYDLQATDSDFGSCSELAFFIADLGVSNTVAFIDKPLTGHAVLVALACEEIVMSDRAKIGDVYRDRPARRMQREQEDYIRISREKGHGSWIPLGMVDESLQLIEIETAAVGKRIVSDKEIETIAKQAPIIKREVIKDPGQRLLLDPKAALRVGLIKLTANSRREVAAAYGLPETVAADDHLLDEARKPVQLVIEGAVDNRMYGYVSRALKRAESQGGDLLFVQVDSSTGDPSAAQSIANALANWPGKTVAWVPRQCTGPAIFVLFGCDELVVGSNAQIGEWQPEKSTPEDLKVLAQAITEMTKTATYPPALIQRFIDPSTIVYEVKSKQNPALRSLKTEEELANPDVAKVWEKAKPGPIRQAGTVLKLTGKEAVSLDFAVAEADSFDALKTYYGLSGSIAAMKPGWVDALVEGLTSTGGTVFLLTLAFVLLYLEANMPGFGIAGLLSALCFVLFFWSRFLAGTAITLEVVMFVMGMLFISLEIFVFPGLGLPGLLGGVLVFGSLVLASQSFSIPQTPEETRILTQNLLKLASSLVLFVAMATGLARYFPHLPFFSRMMLVPPDYSEEMDEEAGSLEEALHPTADLVGKVGTAVSPLRPAGRMLLDERYYDVLAQGAFIESGTPVEVVHVFQNRIIVRSTEIG